MAASVIKVEIFGDNIEIEYDDGSKEEIEFGVYERKDADNETVEERAATEDDYDRLNAIARAADAPVEREFLLDDGTKVELSAGKIEVTFPDGTKEEIENGVYQRKNAANETIEERAATAEDFARLEAFVPAGETIGGDAPGTGAPGDDDGTPDQGSGDAPGTGAPGDDDGTPDQGSGDAPGTETPGDDDGTPDHGAGDAPGTGAPGDDDGTPDQGSGDAPGALGAAADDAPIDRDAEEIVGDDGRDRLRGGNGDDDIIGLGGADRLRGRSGDDSLDGGDGNDRLIGNRGDDTLTGGDGKDRLKGGQGDDVLDGGAGVDRYAGGAGADTFVFGVDGARDHLRGFEAGVDRIDLSAFGLGDFADVLDNARERGGDTYVDLGGGDEIKLHDVSLASLDEADFIL